MPAFRGHKMSSMICSFNLQLQTKNEAEFPQRHLCGPTSQFFSCLHEFFWHRPIQYRRRRYTRTICSVFRLDCDQASPKSNSETLTRQATHVQNVRLRRRRNRLIVDQLFFNLAQPLIGLNNDIKGRFVVQQWDNEECIWKRHCRLGLGRERAPELPYQGGTESRVLDLPHLFVKHKGPIPRAWQRAPSNRDATQFLVRSQSRESFPGRNRQEHPPSEFAYLFSYRG